MRKPFEGSYPVTQTFGNVLIINGVNIYGQYGYKGHNGIDYGTPTGTQILAPHNGKVVEATLDPTGYGLYVKIENSIEGSVLAHFKELRVGVGDVVDEGQLIAISDNSGNSTGPHLHFGYYRLPRDRQNGYGGFIDQMPYLTATIPNQDLQACLLQKDEEIRKKNETWTELQQVKTQLTASNDQINAYKSDLREIAEALGTLPDKPSIIGQISTMTSCEDNLRKVQEKLNNAAGELTKTSQELIIQKQRADNAELANRQQVDMISDRDTTITSLKDKLAKLEALQGLRILIKLPYELFICTTKEVKPV